MLVYLAGKFGIQRDITIKYFAEIKKQYTNSNIKFINNSSLNKGLKSVDGDFLKNEDFDIHSVVLCDEIWVLDNYFTSSGGLNELIVAHNLDKVIKIRDPSYRDGSHIFKKCDLETIINQITICYEHGLKLY